MKELKYYCISLLCLVLVGCQNDISITEKSTIKEISSFTFRNPEVSGVIDPSTYSISVFVPYGTEVNGLIPDIIYEGEKIVPASGLAQDFSQNVIYTVTAEDDTEVSYSVHVEYDFELQGVWKISLSDMDGNVVLPNMIFSFTNTIGLEYLNENDYANTDTCTEGNIIEYNNNEKYFIKQMTKIEANPANIGNYQKITWTISNGTIRQNYYQEYQDLNEAKNSDVIVVTGDGIKI